MLKLYADEEMKANGLCRSTAMKNLITTIILSGALLGLVGCSSIDINDTIDTETEVTIRDEETEFRSETLITSDDINKTSSGIEIHTDYTAVEAVGDESNDELKNVMENVDDTIEMDAGYEELTKDKTEEVIAEVVEGDKVGVIIEESIESTEVVEEIELQVEETIETLSDTPDVEHIQDEIIMLSASPALVNTYTVEASGELVEDSQGCIIDYSNTSDGYVMVKCTKDTDKRIKVQVKGPTTTYTYNLSKGTWEVFPLSDNNGEYKVTVFENVVDTKYAHLVSITFNANMTDEFAPFLRSNQYVNFENDEVTKQLAAELTSQHEDSLHKVESVYNWVISNIAYDKDLAATVQSGYLPDLDKVITSKKGICFDYAALMTGMLRSQGIPCKLVVGYAGTAYHAWISVWSETDGWIDSIIQFSGSTWERMDPTFASTGNQSESIMKYIGDGTNYTVKYLY